jgi:hypothetical protein
MHPAVKILAYVAIGLAVTDLLLGNTSKNPLPDFIANQLTQQTDALLIAGGAAALLLS